MWLTIRFPVYVVHTHLIGSRVGNVGSSDRASDSTSTYFVHLAQKDVVPLGDDFTGLYTVKTESKKPVERMGMIWVEDCTRRNTSLSLYLPRNGTSRYGDENGGDAEGSDPPRPRAEKSHGRCFGPPNLRPSLCRLCRIAEEVKVS